MSTPMAEAFPVGEFLADELEERGWTQGEFAEIIGRPTQFVSEIISGKKEITRDSARQIAAAFDQSPTYWLNLQDSYHLWRQAQDRTSENELDDVRLRAKLSNLAPIGLLRQRGILRGHTVQQQASEMKTLFRIQSLDDVPEILIAARRSNSSDSVTSVQTAWGACARQKAEATTAGIFDRSKLEHVARTLTRTVATPEDFSRIPALFAEAGVRIVFLEAFPGSKMDGCSFLLDDGSPAIAISGRGKRLDKVLFTILHEAAHILLNHLNADQMYIIDDKTANPTLGLEEPADQLAASWALPSPLPRLPERINQGWITSVAQMQGVHPLVLIGHLQWSQSIPWRTTLVRDAPSVISQLQRW